MLCSQYQKESTSFAILFRYHKRKLSGNTLKITRFSKSQNYSLKFLVNLKKLIKIVTIIALRVLGKNTNIAMKVLKKKSQKKIFMKKMEKLLWRFLKKESLKNQPLLFWRSLKISSINSFEICWKKNLEKFFRRIWIKKSLGKILRKTMFIALKLLGKLF